MSKIFFPLRSNSAWFAGSDTRASLEKRLKTTLLIYDEIILQDAQYQCTIWEDGSFDILIPPEKIGFDRTKINFFKPGSNASLRVAPTGSKSFHQLIGGKAQIGYQADFFPILNDAGLLNAEYVRLLYIDVNQRGKKIAEQEAKKDERNPELVNIISPNSFTRSKVLQAFYIDSLLSLNICSPFSVDYHVGPVFSWKRNQTKLTMKPPIRELFFNHWISLGLPDYSDVSWEDIDKVRNSSAGIDFRKMIDRMVEKVSETIPELDDERELAHLVESLFAKEVVDELVARLPSKKDTLFNLGLNLIPYGLGAVVGGIKDFTNAALAKRSWISLLKPLP